MATDQRNLHRGIRGQTPGGSQSDPEDRVQPGIVQPRLVLAYLFASNLALGFGLALVPALATTFRSIYGLSGWDVANLQNLKDFGAITFVLAGPVILHRIGLFAALNAAILTGLSGCCVFLLVPGVIGLMLGTFLHGAAFALGTMTIVTMLFRLPVRFQHISAMFATFGLASFLAPASVALVVTAGRGYALEYLLYVLILTPILLAGLGLSRTQGPNPNENVGARAARFLSKQQLRYWALDLLAYSALMAAETVVATWIMSLAQYRYAATIATASALLTTLWGVHAIVRIFGDVLARKLSSRSIVLIGSIIAICGVIIACLGNITLAYVGMVIFAMGMAPLLPIYQRWILLRIPGSEHAPMNAALTIAGTVSITVMIWITGLLLDIDNRIPFIVSIALLLASVIHVARTPAAHDGV